MDDLAELLGRVRNSRFYEILVLFGTANKIQVYQQEHFFSCLPSAKAQVVKDIFESGGADYLLQIASSRNPGHAFSSSEEVRKYYRELLDLSKEKLRPEVLTIILSKFLK